MTAGLSLLLGLHLLPGFSNPAIVRDVLMSPGAQPYSQYLNFDKTLGGVLLLGGIGWRPMRSAAEWAVALRRTVPLILATVVVAMAGSLALGFVRFEPRWTQLFWVWAPINLLTTCVSEEAFFRQLLQTELRSGSFADGAPRTRSPWAAAPSCSGWRMRPAGGDMRCSPAWRARVTPSCSSARPGWKWRSLTHFTVNAVHFLLFTYPALTSASP